MQDRNAKISVNHARYLTLWHPHPLQSHSQPWFSLKKECKGDGFIPLMRWANSPACSSVV